MWQKIPQYDCASWLSIKYMLHMVFVGKYFSGVTWWFFDEHELFYSFNFALNLVELINWCNLQIVVNACHSCPGRTFLGKRRYFSGIAALTPLTPLTYKQNAVNAFIPTKKTPLTPLYRQGTPLTLLYQKKLVSSKNWFSHSVKNEKLTVNHLLDKRLRSF